MITEEKTGCLILSKLKRLLNFRFTSYVFFLNSSGYHYVWRVSTLALCFLQCKSSFYYIFLDMSEFREVFSKAKHIAIITGAGVSAESGVPTFRGKNEKWRKWLSQVSDKEATHTFTWMHFIFSLFLFHFFFFL